MNVQRPSVNIVHRYGTTLFTPHFDPVRDGFDVVENGPTDRAWDLVVVFEALSERATYKVREGGTVFVAGEPPEIGNHASAFLEQFDAVFCAGTPTGVASFVSNKQHFNNWHFGYSTGRSGYRYDHRDISNMPPPVKTHNISTVTSNLNYLPMHIRRRALIDRLALDYADKIDIFGRPHRFVEYKEDAIIPYRFHICIENCSIPDIWTEKVADSILAYSVPLYAGCTNIEDYFPGATISIDLDDYAGTRKTIDEILRNGESIYQARLKALTSARESLITEFDISTLISHRLAVSRIHNMRDATLKPQASFPFARTRAILARTQRKITTIAWRRKVSRLA